MALALFLVVSPAWFWSHCARPTLDAQQATPMAYRIVLGTTIMLMAASTFDLVGELAQLDLTAWLYGLFILIWASWVLIVGLGYLQGYRLLIRATDRRPRRSI